MSGEPPERRWQGGDDEMIELRPVGPAGAEPPRSTDTRPRFYWGKADTPRGERWWECGATEDKDGYLLYCQRLWRWHRGPHEFVSGLDRKPS